MEKRLLAGFLTMCLLLGGCSADRESSTSLEGDPPRQEEVSREKPEFVKVKYAYFEDPEDPQRYYEGFYESKCFSCGGFSRLSVPECLFPAAVKLRFISR